MRAVALCVPLLCRSPGGVAHGIKALRQRSLVKKAVQPVRHHAEAVADVVARPGLVGGHEAGDLALTLRRADDGANSMDIARMLELAGMPIKLVRSKCPSHSTSTPSTAAISSAASAPRAVSICAITCVRAWAAAILSATNLPRSRRAPPRRPRRARRLPTGSGYSSRSLAPAPRYPPSGP